MHAVGLAKQEAYLDLLMFQHGQPHKNWARRLFIVYDFILSLHHAKHSLGPSVWGFIGSHALG